MVFWKESLKTSKNQKKIDLLTTTAFLAKVLVHSEVTYHRIKRLTNQNHFMLQPESEVFQVEVRVVQPIFTLL